MYLPSVLEIHVSLKNLALLAAVPVCQFHQRKFSFFLLFITFLIKISQHFWVQNPNSSMLQLLHIMSKDTFITFLCFSSDGHLGCYQSGSPHSHHCDRHSQACLLNNGEFLLGIYLQVRQLSHGEETYLFSPHIHIFTFQRMSVLNHIPICNTENFHMLISTWFYRIFSCCQSGFPPY